MVITVWTIAILLALIGLGSIFRVAFARQFAPGACRNCGYDCSSLTTPTCPECGRPPNLSKRARTRRPWLLAPIAVLLALPLLALLFPNRTAQLIPHFLPARETVESRTIGKTTVRVIRPFALPFWLDERLKSLHIEVDSGFGEAVLEVTNRVAPPIELKDWVFYFGSVHADGVPSPGSRDETLLQLKDAPIADLDADGAPDLLIGSHSGGAHCCWTYYILSLAEKPAITLTLQANNGAAFSREGDATVIRTIDSVWDYWNACYACSYKPEVVLRFSRGKLSLAVDQMFKPLPNKSVLNTTEQSMRSIVTNANGNLDGLSNGPADAPDFWRVPLELLYSGHEPEALALIRRAWPDTIPGRDAFIADFTKNFEQSPWSAQMRQAFGH